MKERPILFSGPMVRAILDGRKTQTRRVIKDQSIGERFSHMTDAGLAHLEWLGEPRCGTGVWDVPEYSADVACPHGQPGHMLWVRETFGFGGDAYAPDVHYRATHPDAPIQGRWHPSIHMPRAACRITLEVNAVRVERLQDISEDDCWAEGIEEVMHEFDGASQWEMAKRLGCCIDDAKPLYAQLWEFINGSSSWDANPWVWVIEFKRIT